MEYIHEGSALPVPLNVIPTPKSLSRLVVACASRCFRRRRTPPWLKWRSNRCSGRHKGANSGRREIGLGFGGQGDALDTDEHSPIYNGNYPVSRGIGDNLHMTRVSRSAHFQKRREG